MDNYGGKAAIVLGLSLLDARLTKLCNECQDNEEWGVSSMWERLQYAAGCDPN